MDLQSAIASAVQEAFASTQPSDEAKAKTKRKNNLLGASKFLGIVASVVVSAYVGIQQAINERPTRNEVDAAIVEVEDDHKKAESRVDELEFDVNDIGNKVDALDKKVSEGFSDLKEELRYLRRNR